MLNKKTIKLFLSGPDLFYPNSVSIINNKNNILKSIIENKYNFEFMAPGNNKFNMPSGCIRYWQYLLGNKDINLVPQDFKDVETIINEITQADCNMINKLVEDKSSLGICLCNLDPFPSILAYNADPGTVFEYGYANGMIKYHNNLFALAYYENKNLELLDNKMANLYGGFKECYLTEYGIKDKNDNYIICWNLRENAMLEYTDTSRILDKNNIKTVYDSIEEAAYNIVKIADLYFQNLIVR
ncbi:nucleoside 2-deoxyribosyltransferase [uncultured bacterium]|nr:nucleoside 2-deoxyribosyltransferase [uncultured bacterium]